MQPSRMDAVGLYLLRWKDTHDICQVKRHVIQQYVRCDLIYIQAHLVL